MLRTVMLAALLALPALPAAAKSDEKPVTRHFPVRVAIDATGTVTSAESMREIPAVLRDPVLAAARRARFEPATVDGVPARSRSTLTVAMELTPKDDTILAKVADVTAGGGFTMPIPRYPLDAARQGVSAKLQVQAAFDDTGRIDVARSSIVSVQTAVEGRGRATPRQAEMEAAFRKAVLAALPDWSHEPEEVEGRGVPLVKLVPVTFCIGNGCEKFDTAAEQPTLADTAGAAVQLATLIPAPVPATGG